MPTKRKKIKYLINSEGRECIRCKKFFSWDEYKKDNIRNQKINNYCTDCREDYYQRRSEKPRPEPKYRKRNAFSDEDKYFLWNGEDAIFC